jgi:glycine/D-amino acid oxidase-like deaminating enzyme
MTKLLETTRAALIAQLEQSEEFDITIIGGGATGLGVALDAALRGFKVLLLESHDFAKGHFVTRHQAGAWRCALLGAGQCGAGVRSLA